MFPLFDLNTHSAELCNVPGTIQVHPISLSDGPRKFDHYETMLLPLKLTRALATIADHSSTDQYRIAFFMSFWGEKQGGLIEGETGLPFQRGTNRIAFLRHIQL